MQKRIIITLTLVIMTAVTTSCKTWSERPRIVDGNVVLEQFDSPKVEGYEATQLASAKAAYEARDFRRASQIYHQLVDQDPDNLEYLKLYATSSRKAGYYEAAIAAYDKYLKARPIEEENSKNDDTEEESDKKKKFSEDSLEALEGKGLALLSMGDREGASDIFATVMSYDPTRWRTLNALGLLFVIRGNDISDAMAYFTEALVHSPNNIQVLNNVGLSLALHNKLDDAIEALETASELAVGKNAALKKHIDMNLAMVYGIKGDIKKAEIVASRHLKGAELNNNLGFYSYLANDDMMAKSYLNMALSSSKRHYERAWQNLEAISKTEKQNSKNNTKKGKSKSIKVK